MGYQKQNFVDCQVLNSAQLNHIEDGIVDLESNSSTAFAGKADKTEVQANAKSISDETTRAQTAESALSTKITEETERAKAAEQANADGIAAEASRAKGEEQRLDTAITAETARAQKAETDISGKVTALDDAFQALGLKVVDGKLCVVRKQSTATSATEVTQNA